MSTHRILIASYKKDFEWLWPNLRSLKRHMQGFLPPVISVSSEDAAECRALVAQTFPEATVWTKDGPPDLGNLRAQVSMMHGDRFGSPADYVWLVGSDCIVSGTFSPDSFFRNGKPVMLMNSYEHLLPFAPGIAPWRAGVENAIGSKPDFEFMRRLPLIYPVELFDRVRRHLEARHGVPFEDYVYSVGAYAQKSNRSDAANFSESNVLGAYAYIYMPEAFEWVNLDDNYDAEMAKLPSPLIQFWSHGGLETPCDCRFDYPGGNTFGKTPRQIIREILV